MYELNKTAFGSFLAQLRREKGMTQKRSLPPACMFRIKPSANGSAEFPIVKDTTPNITTPRLYGT